MPGANPSAAALATASAASASPRSSLRRVREQVGGSALVRAGSSASYLLGELEYEIRANTINTFGGGVNEIQRELIAQFGLGMPRPVR